MLALELDLFLGVPDIVIGGKGFVELSAIILLSCKTLYFLFEFGYLLIV